MAQPQHPSIKVVKMATKSSYMDISDPNPVFLEEEIYPHPDDIKNEKLIFSLTVIGEGQGHNKFFRHWIDTRKVLLLCHMIEDFEKGEGERCYLPGFPEYKGSKDSLHPEWELTSRTFGVRYRADGRYGPSYEFEYAYCKGIASRTGAVMPDSGSTATRGSMIVPIFGQVGKSDPWGLIIAEKVKQYLYAREAAKQVIMAQSMRDLRYYANKGERKSEDRLNDIYNDLSGKKRDNDYRD